MKFTKVFACILGVHAVGVLILLLVQSGCRQGSYEVKEPDTRAPIVPDTLAHPQEADGPDDAAAEAKTVQRFEPKRPVNDGFDAFADEPRDAAPPSLPETPKPQPALVTPREIDCMHTVQPKDSLWKIANQYGLTLPQLLALNRSLTRDSLIRPGQQIIVGKSSEHPVLYVAASSEVYCVQGGDTLSKIARRHGLSVAQLKALNNLKSDTIRVGQKLRTSGTAPLPAATKKATPSASVDPHATVHVVAPGQTASDIAKLYHVKVSDLLLVNGITNPKKLQINQKLRIPSHDATAPLPAVEAAAPLPTPEPHAAQPHDDAAADTDEAAVDPFEVLESTP